MKWHGGGDGGLCEGVIPLVGSAVWCWLSALLRVEVVDLIGGGFGGGLKLWIWFFFFFFWNLYSLFLSSNGLVCGNCKDLVRHTWSVAHSGLYRWLGRRVNQSG